MAVEEDDSYGAPSHITLGKVRLQRVAEAQICNGSDRDVEGEHCQGEPAKELVYRLEVITLDTAAYRSTRQLPDRYMQQFSAFHRDGRSAAAEPNSCSL